jgi:type III pantothenate kinase
MRLLVDIGNTSIKWATLHRAEREPRAGASARHAGALPLDLLATWDAMEDVTDVVAACVGPRKVADAVERICSARWGIMPRWIETLAASHGVRIAYSQPERLGVDRFLALIAAHRDAQDASDGQGPDRPSLIVDAGTAVTYDLLQADGAHLGGLILPGVQLLRDSILAGTQIPRYEPLDAAATWAADTGEAVAAASLQAPAALAERVYGQLQTKAGLEPRLIITGGDADRLMPLLTCPHEHRPDLVLAGLAAFV